MTETEIAHIIVDIVQSGAIIGFFLGLILAFKGRRDP